jgi:hypothetical protein
VSQISYQKATREALHCMSLLFYLEAMFEAF